jgi:hypothetical protein
MLRRGFTLCLGLTALALSAACSTSKSSGTGASTTTSGSGGFGGGPVSGAADMHCVGVTPQPTDQSVCHDTTVPDAGSAGGGGSGGGASEYGPTMYGTEGDDDDCKYHVTWKSTPMGLNTNVTFTVSAVYLTDGNPNPPECTGCPVTGASTITEVYLDDTHPAPNAPTVTTESPKGTYEIGPIVFDAPGKWTVRFHFFEDCADILPSSPHGHAAFYVDVP